MLINLCVCTYLRETQLAACLSSLSEVRRPEGAELSVTVVDNDDCQSAESLVAALKEDFPFELHYFCEPKRGIPCARNKAITVSNQLGADYLVFIDDDEWVEPDWLNHLYGYCLESGGDAVVSGVVLSELPDSVPPSIAALFNNKTYHTGQLLSACATNNVIVPMRLINRFHASFDESLPLAGGTDTVFFYQLSTQGVVIYKCVEAVVHESIPETRANLRWLSRRKFRAGITEAWRRKQKGRSPFSIASTSVFHISMNTLKAILLAVSGLSVQRNKSWLKTCRAAGVLVGVLGVKVDSY